jgi:hypothetical protein
MPINEYFGGHGNQVMSSMVKTYNNAEKAKQVFYAMNNARKKKPLMLGSKARRLKQARDAAKASE